MTERSPRGPQKDRAGSQGSELSPFRVLARIVRRSKSLSMWSLEVAPARAGPWVAALAARPPGPLLRGRERRNRAKCAVAGDGGHTEGDQFRMDLGRGTTGLRPRTHPPPGADEGMQARLDPPIEASPRLTSNPSRRSGPAARRRPGLDPQESNGAASGGGAPSTEPGRALGASGKVISMVVRATDSSCRHEEPSLTAGPESAVDRDLSARAPSRGRSTSPGIPICDMARGAVRRRKPLAEYGESRV